MQEIDEIYYDLCFKLSRHGKIVGDTKELINVKIELENIEENIVSIRGISPSYLFGEWLWYFTGNNSTQFISSFGSMWKKLTDDGKTSNSAYGYIMQYKFGFNQIETVIKLLLKDPTSRRAVININTPNKNVIETKDEPCTIALQFFIREEKLHCTAIMRSNDIWYGFPYDVAFFTELQKFIATKIGIKCGTYTHFVTSLHLYKRNYDEVCEIINSPKSKIITFNRNKFYANMHFVGNLIEIASEQCKADDVKKLMVILAEEYFDFKEEERPVGAI